jgi:anti-sigma B factor antagonist
MSKVALFISQRRHAIMDLEMEDLGNDCRVVRLQGRLDALGVERLESKFNAAVAAGGHHALIDLSRVDFVASLGLRMFIMAVRAGVRKGKQIVFFGAQPAVRQVLEHSAFEKIAPLAEDQEAARALVS